MITIKEAVTKSELKEYIKFPFSLYKNEPNWIPPLIADELATSRVVISRLLKQLENDGRILLYRNEIKLVKDF